MVRWYALLTDIEDRKRAEEVLRESERSIRLIVDGIAGLVAIMAPNGQVEFVNNQTREYFGRTLEELTIWRTSDAVHPDDLPGWSPTGPTRSKPGIRMTLTTAYDALMVHTAGSTYVVCRCGTLKIALSAGIVCSLTLTTE